MLTPSLGHRKPMPFMEHGCSSDLWEGWFCPWKMHLQIGILGDREFGLGSGVQEREVQKALDWAQGLFMGSWKPFCMWCQWCSMKQTPQVSLVKGRSHTQLHACMKIQDGTSNNAQHFSTAVVGVVLSPAYISSSGFSPHPYVADTFVFLFFVEIEAENSERLFPKAVKNGGNRA